jgi:hypothetical protein
MSDFDPTASKDHDVARQSDMPDEVNVYRDGYWIAKHVEHREGFRYIRADLVAERDAEIDTDRAAWKEDCAMLKAAIIQSFETHGSAPTDCDCDKCMRLSELLGLLAPTDNAALAP